MNIFTGQKRYTLCSKVTRAFTNVINTMWVKVKHGPFCCRRQLDGVRYINRGGGFDNK